MDSSHVRWEHDASVRRASEGGEDGGRLRRDGDWDGPFRVVDADEGDTAEVLSDQLFKSWRDRRRGAVVEWFILNIRDVWVEFGAGRFFEYVESGPVLVEVFVRLPFEPPDAVVVQWPLLAYSDAGWVETEGFVDFDDGSCQSDKHDIFE